MSINKKVHNGILLIFISFNERCIVCIARKHFLKSSKNHFLLIVNYIASCNIIVIGGSSSRGVLQTFRALEASVVFSARVI